MIILPSETDVLGGFGVRGPVIRRGVNAKKGNLYRSTFCFTVYT